jgi:hypothetical protein
MLSLGSDIDFDADEDSIAQTIDTSNDYFSNDSESLSFDLTDFVGLDSFSLDDFLADSGATISITW